MKKDDQFWLENTILVITIRDFFSVGVDGFEHKIILHRNRSRMKKYAVCIFVQHFLESFFVLAESFLIDTAIKNEKNLFLYS